METLRISLLSCLLGAVALGGTFQDGRASFDLDVNGRRDHYSIRLVSVLPGEVVKFSASRGKRRLSFAIEAAAGTLSRGARACWTWRAPGQPGLYPITVRLLPGGEVTQVTAFVMVPYSRIRDEALESYPIGRYPASNDSGYETPRGFIEVTQQNQETMVSPHFQLKQFLCKQEGGFPKFLILREALVGKLERVLAKVNQMGVRVDTLFVMSGYRTPHYNHALGNVKLSRHMYGDAADVFPEGAGTPGRMADLNGDGKVDINDSILLHRWIEELESASPEIFPPGGIGVYEATQYHGPFVHIDARGKRARWSGEIAAATAKGL